MGCEDDAEMSYFPGMKMRRTEKLTFVRWALDLYRKSFDVTTIIDQIRLLDPDRVSASSSSTLVHGDSLVQGDSRQSLAELETHEETAEAGC